MTLHAIIHNRDFSTQPIRPINLRIDKLTWSIYGGPDEAYLSAGSSPERLLEYASLLRCPITISEEFSIPAWWGYINKISFYFEKINFIVDLEVLFNRVNVKYSFISPDGKFSEYSETGFANNTFSTTEFGIREIVLKQNNVDDNYALNLRDTFLDLSAFPRSILSPSSKFGDPIIKLHCKGWFHTLDWVSYENLDGFYANHGPGPGGVESGNGSVSLIAQSFTPASSVDLKYAYFLMRKQGSPTSTIYARLYSDSADTPNAILATSAGVSGSTLPQYNYTWVKFTFASAYTLTAGTKYWIVFNPNTSSATNYYHLRIDENSNFNQPNHYAKLLQASWIFLYTYVHPNAVPDLMFRVVCEQDTGEQLFDIATASNQFFTFIGNITSGINTSPYRYNGFSGLKEVLSLMKLGTSNQRLITSCVNPQRRLYWYEQPDPNVPTVYLDRHGRYFSLDQKLIQPYFPPIGQFATVSGIDRLSMPFDRHRIPTYFVDQATYTP